MSQLRQLAAIMFTDIVGYTALMGKDEDEAFSILKKNRQIQRPLIDRHHGKWLKEMGDGILASFHTVSDAVYCALQIQNSCSKEKGLYLRIGIHLGEVVFENGDVFGDGVNIASRLQSIAQSGDILVSESVYRNISNKKGLTVEFLKEEILKNVDSPIKIYRVKMKNDTYSGSQDFFNKRNNSYPGFFSRKRLLYLMTIAILLIATFFLYKNFAGKKETERVMSVSASEKKSIAVLPFKDMSAEQDQGYLGDGIADEILNVLNNTMKDLNVTGRTSSFSFKDKGIDLKTIGKTLNVKAILDGSVQRFGDQLRITVQLVNAEDGYNIWSERYDRKLKDIFSIQDDIATKVKEKLKLTLFENVITEPRQVNLEAYEMVLKGNFYFNQGPEGFEKAVEYHKKAIAIDTAYAYPYIRLAWAIYQQTLYNMYPSKVGFPMAKAAINKALSLEVTSAEKHSAHFALAFTNLWEYSWKDAWGEYETALAINPKRNDFNAFYQAFVLGRTSDAVVIFKKVVNENPVDVLSLRDFALIQYLNKEYENALQTCDKILELANFSDAYRLKGCIFSVQNKFDLALDNFGKSAEMGNPWAQIQFLTALAHAGKTDEVKKLMQSTQIPAIGRALISHSLGDKDKAFEWLEKAYAEKHFWLASVQVEPLWNPLRSDPRFQKLIRKMNFPK